MRLPPVAVIVVSELFGTALWFSANGVADALAEQWRIGTVELGWLTNAVQFGFICGTLVFALTGLADRFAASRIFALCALLGSAFNAAFALFAGGIEAALPLRFAVGFCLAGVYPLGMKLVVGWVPERAGEALALLVGMLVLGTALPHGVRWAGASWPWQAPILVASMLALVAAAMILMLGDGPHLRRRANAPPMRLGRVLIAFSQPDFRASALGYFGHQWELYAMWTLVPVLARIEGVDGHFGGASAVAFAVMAVGAACCVAGGRLSASIGSARVAALALATSTACCALFPLAGAWQPAAVFGLLLLWGASAVADSPHFSALSARACPPEIVGSALALQNALGFAITMISIAIGTHLVETWGSRVAWLLLPGPLLGLIALRPLVSRGA
ncbi:MAG: MFS transporter [Rhodocyclaceae bacterium]|nr:MFS transporter [Rhodocyclaceae bacterium]